MYNYKKCNFWRLKKKILGPVHLHPKTDKWDYLWSPIMKKIFVSCFDIGEVPRSPGKWNWNWLYFLPYIFTFGQGAYAIISWKKYTKLSYHKGCGITAFNQSNILGCDTFIYDLHYFDETLATLHDLVCKEEYKTQLLNR